MLRLLTVYLTFSSSIHGLSSGGRFLPIVFALHLQSVSHAGRHAVQ